MGDNKLNARYQRLTQKEHVLKRPGMYVGATSMEPQDAWTLSTNSKRVAIETVKYVPGLLKIFDEILVNAIDHVTRTRIEKVDPVTKVSVTIGDGDAPEISIENNGRSPDVAVHPKIGRYIPEIIFTELLSSTNYDDAQERLIGGMNGIGAALTGIFSTKFKIEIVDAERRKKYVQICTGNLSKIGDPKVTDIKAASPKPSTKISFVPDYKRFGVEGLHPSMRRLMNRRVFDAAALTPRDVKVQLNGADVPVKRFPDYVAMFGLEDVVMYEDDRWKVGVAASEDGNFQHVSFVNGVSTLKGGTHVSYVANTISKLIADKGSTKDRVIKPTFVRDNMTIFVSATVPNPSFSSQSKEELVSPQSKFGTYPVLDAKFAARVAKQTGILDRASAVAVALDNRKLAKAAGKRVSRLVVPNLDDANMAGTKNSDECTLILTEGLSAKTMALSAFAIIGRDRWGAFPLRGKLLNVSEKSVSTAVKNEEIGAIIKILGLKPGRPDDVSEMRYGRVLILADQDYDGIHIRGLVMNLFRSMFPALFEKKGFLVSMLTPIIKATMANGTMTPFYSTRSFQAWSRTNKPKRIRYLKGLGSSTSAEAKDYFREMKLVTYVSDAKGGEMFDLAFNKARADDRKRLIMKYESSDFEDVDYSRLTLGHGKFVTDELVQFSLRDVQRSIPSFVDGFKESQRKILYGVFKRNPSEEIKVSQLAGFVAETAAYHHGDASLTAAIVGMARKFPGANNLPFLEGIGQFGSRVQGGSDAASARYISTRAATAARMIFRKEDDCILDYLEDDGSPIEPRYYLPVIPAVLLNGASGIATGFSTNIPAYNPLDLARAVGEVLDGGTITPLVPWFAGWHGTVERVSPNKKGVPSEGWQSVGAFSRATGNKRIDVTELPVGTWSESYKEFLQSLVDAGTVKNFKSMYTDTEARFEVVLADMTVTDERVATILKLTSPKGLTVANIHLLDERGAIKRYKSPEAIVREWTQWRLEKYGDRKRTVVKKLQDEYEHVSAKARFVDDVVTKRVRLLDVPEADVKKQLISAKYPPRDNFEYLLSINARSFTKEYRENLRATSETTRARLDELKRKTPETLFRTDLSEFTEFISSAREG